MEVESLAEKPAKKKHKKKSSKYDKHNNSEAQVNGVTNNITVTSNPALSLKLLASNSALKMSYDVKRVPMDPDKMTAGISFCNVGNFPISSIELDFVDTANIQVVRESPDRGIRLEMDLDAGKIEDHLFLFKVSWFIGSQKFKHTFPSKINHYHLTSFFERVSYVCITKMETKLQFSLEI